MEEMEEEIMWEKLWRTEKLMSELIGKAKKAVVRAWEGRETTERRWHTISFIPYGNMKDHRLEIHILVGTPVKGFVVANYGLGVVVAYDYNQKEIRRYNVVEEGLKRWEALKRTSESSSSSEEASSSSSGEDAEEGEASELIKKARSIVEGY